MPIFEYICQSCQKEFEFFLVRSDEEVLCPECNGADVDRVLSVVGFKAQGRFKSSAKNSGCSGCSASSCSHCSSGG